MSHQHRQVAISNDELARMVQAGPSTSLLLVDCRPFSDFNRGHVRFSVNAFYSKMMRRRLCGSKVDSAALLSHLSSAAGVEREDCQENQDSCKWKEIFAFMDIILYGDEEVKRPCQLGLKRRHPSDVPLCTNNNNNNNNGLSTPTDAKFLRMMKDRIDDTRQFGNVRILDGGFSSFRSAFPTLVESSSPSPSQHQSSSTLVHCPRPLSSSAVSPVCGLPPLRLQLSPAAGAASPMNCSAPGGSLSQPCLTPQQGPTQILPFLFLGSQQDSLDRSFLEKNGIKYILNLSITCPVSDYVNQDDEHFLRIAVNDSHQDKLLPHFQKAYEFLEKVRKRKSVALIHCLAGISRSPTVCISYIMRHLRLNSDDAYKFVKLKRPNIAPNFNFMGQLLDHERRLREDGVLPPKNEDEIRAEREVAASHHSAAEAEQHRSASPFAPMLKMPKSASSHAILTSSSKSRIPKEAKVHEEDEDLENDECPSTELNENGKRGMATPPRSTLCAVELLCQSSFTTTSAPSSLTIARPDCITDVQRPKMLFSRPRRSGESVSTTTSPRPVSLNKTDELQLPSPSTELSRLSFDRDNMPCGYSQGIQSRCDLPMSADNPCFVSPTGIRPRREEGQTAKTAHVPSVSSSSAFNPFFASPTSSSSTTDFPSKTSSSPTVKDASHFFHKIIPFFKRSSTHYARPDCLERAGQPHVTTPSMFSSSPRSTGGDSSLGSSVLSSSTGASSHMTSLPEQSDESGYPDSESEAAFPRHARDDPERASLGSTSSHEITVN